MHRLCLNHNVNPTARARVQTTGGRSNISSLVKNAVVIVFFGGGVEDKSNKKYI